MQEINFTSTILKNDIATIALMAANRGEGNTTATVEMAFAMKTYSKGRVLTVDMSAMGPGLADAIRQRVGKELEYGQKEEFGPVNGVMAHSDGVFILSLDEGEAEKLNLDRTKTAAWLETLASSYDYVLFDMPSFSRNPEYVIFLQSVNGVVLTLNCKTSRWDSALNMKERLSEANVNIIGAVLNQRIFPIPGSIYSLL